MHPWATPQYTKEALTTFNNNPPVLQSATTKLSTPQHHLGRLTPPRTIEDSKAKIGALIVGPRGRPHVLLLLLLLRYYWSSASSNHRSVLTSVSTPIVASSSIQSDISENLRRVFSMASSSTNRKKLTHVNTKK